MPKQRTDPEERPAQSKSARTKERILDAAAKVLNQNGYAGTRLSDIAELAHVQAPALYYYFDSREQLIEEVVNLGMTRALRHVTDSLDQLPPDATKLDRICVAVAAHLEVVLRLSDYASAAIRYAPQLPADMRQRQLEAQRHYGDVWRTLIDEARAAGEIHSELDPGAARMLILGGLNWATEWWNPDRGSLHSVIRTAQLLARHGLSAAPKTDSKPAPVD